jgi:peroxiredoxin Q/BCP
MSYKLNIGDPIPSFKLPEENGESLTEEDLLGNPLIIYFYPKDDTPGCTKQACDFRDNMSRLTSIDAIVIGISPDNAKSHEQFRQKYNLNYILLPDENKMVCTKFDVIHDDRLERTTFIVDSGGIIRWIERPVKVEGHVQRVIKAVEEINEKEEE